MKIVGITGGIGSGKTIVSKIFETLLIPVYNADLAAKKLMVQQSDLIENIKNLFGKEAYFEDQSLNRKHISAMAFTNKALLQKLNQLVHPAIYHDFELWKSKQHSKYVIKEAAILFESKSYLQCDETLLIYADEAVRIERVMQRDHITEAQVKDRIANQMSDQEKMKLAHHQILNNGNNAILPQVFALHHHFSSNHTC